MSIAPNASDIFVLNTSKCPNKCGGYKAKGQLSRPEAIYVCQLCENKIRAENLEKLRTQKLEENATCQEDKIKALENELASATSASNIFSENVKKDIDILSKKVDKLSTQLEKVSGLITDLTEGYDDSFKMFERYHKVMLFMEKVMSSNKKIELTYCQ